MTPTARALREMKRRGWDAQCVERFNVWSKTRLDLFGVIDIVAIDGAHVYGVQVTSGTNHAARIAKIQAEPRAKRWLESGAHMAVWSYRLGGKRGKRKLYVLREEPITLAHFAKGQP